MKLTKRETWLLKDMLSFDITRYLMANSCQRLDSGEKADRHISMSKILCRFILAGVVKMPNEIEIGTTGAWNEVHDYLADILTDRMDEVIGFPIYKELYGSDYDIFEERFFQTIIDHIDEIEKIVINSYNS